MPPFASSPPIQPSPHSCEKVFYLYQHIPKCGGVSFIRACRQWFPALREKTGSYPTPERTAEFARSRPDIDGFAPNTLVHGHLVRDGIRPFERYGDHVESGRCRVLTIVRDPLERWVSAYYHRQRIGKPWPEPLAKWLLRGRNEFATLFNITDDNWRARLDAYFLVGTTEEMQLTTDVLAKKTGNEPVEIPHLNTSPRDGGELDGEAIEQFKRHNQFDYAIHKYATARIRREALELGLLGGH